jgi:hypothetical protein
MSLPASEERALTRIEQMLLSRDPRLKSLFGIFTRLTGQEAMPATEQLQPRRWRLHSAPVIAIVLALVVGVIVVTSLTTAPVHTCGTPQPGFGVVAQPASNTSASNTSAQANHNCLTAKVSKNP